MKKNIFKQITVGLVAGGTLLAAVSPVSVAFSDVSNQNLTAQKVSDNKQLSESFISKYDSTIKLENNKFILDQNLINTSSVSSNKEKLRR